MYIKDFSKQYLWFNGLKVLYNGGIWTFWERSFDSQKISERNVHNKEWTEDSGNLQR